MYKVLIVDDEPTVIHGLCEQIDWESLNMELAGKAISGKEALSLMTKQPIDLLITDVSMPEMNGLTLIEKAKLIHPSMRYIIISAYDEFDYVKKALKLGVENYLLKPINQSELNDTLNKTLKNMEQDRIPVSDISSDILAFRNNILDRWVNGAIQDFELYERAQLLHINLSYPQYIVCILNAIDPINVDQRIEQSIKLLNLSRKILPSEYEAECFIDGYFRVVWIIQGENLSCVEGDLNYLLARTHKEAKLHGIRIFCSVGPIATSFQNVSTSYRCAAFYLNYYILNPNSITIFCSHFPDIQQDSASKDLAMLLQFNNALKSVNLRHALGLSKKYFDGFDQDTVPKLKTAITPFLLSLIKTIIQSGRPSDRLPHALLVQFTDFSSIKSFDKLKYWMENIIEMALRTIEERKGTFHLLIRLALEEVNARYHEDLSLKTLAASFDVTPAYLGQLFKSETGELFNDYLTQVRLEAARDLLLKTELKVGEIASRVGISNQSYFNRLFKKYFGISPTDFRRRQ